jgi:hypothetical protein
VRPKLDYIVVMKLNQADSYSRLVHLLPALWLEQHPDNFRYKLKLSPTDNHSSLVHLLPAP